VGIVAGERPLRGRPRILAVPSGATAGCRADRLGAMLRVHLDTDLGSDTDDLCALAMLLGWPDVEVVGVTTV
jgi:hypothetical protein